MVNIDVTRKPFQHNDRKNLTNVSRVKWRPLDHSEFSEDVDTKLVASSSKLLAQ
jgi:hypothetical protein